MTSMKIFHISRPPISPPDSPFSIYVQKSSTFLTFDVQFQTYPLSMITNQLNKKHNLR